MSSDDFMMMAHVLSTGAADQHDDEDLDCAIAFVSLAQQEAHEVRRRRRQPTRKYLCRPQLLPNPRAGTPWQQLYDSKSDRAFITTMGFDVETFEDILTAGFGDKWYSTPIPRGDVNVAGDPRPGARSLDAAGALGLVLHYINSTMDENSLGQIFALIPTTVSRYINFGLSIYLETLRTMTDTSIRWPTGGEFQEYSELITERHPLLDGAFGSIDGLNLPVQTSLDTEIENATYNGWLQEHFVSSVFVFSPKGLIIAANTNAPGSWHDSRVAKPIYEKLQHRTPDGYFLVADTAFPRGTDQISGRIKAPLKPGDCVNGSAEVIDGRLAFDRQLLSYRQTAEWGMRGIQGSFGRLRIPLSIAQSGQRADLLESCLRSHNLRTMRVGINQIKTVYQPYWRHTKEDDEIWLDFERICFADQRRNDRVLRFHTTIVYE